ncbi:MAG: hypothetical protein ACM3XM_17560 [Mycobacterium leprae]
MSVLFCLLGWALMLASTAAMAILPRLAPHPLLFILAGGLLTGVITGCWLLSGLAVGRWPRPRAGLLLMLFGLIATAVNLLEGRLSDGLWGILVLLAGGGISFPVSPMSRVAAGQAPADADVDRRSVRPPLGRRQSS